MSTGVWAAISLALLKLWHWLWPESKWERKREQARKALKEIDSELEEVTLLLVEAKKTNNAMACAALDMERQRLLANRSACQHEYDYFSGLCDKVR